MFAANRTTRDLVMRCSNAAATARTEAALFVASDFCRRPGFGKHHPLSIPRVSAVLELCACLGWLDEKHLRSSRVATVAELGSFHDPEYVAALTVKTLSTPTPFRTIDATIGPIAAPTFTTV